MSEQAAATSVADARPALESTSWGEIVFWWAVMVCLERVLPILALYQCGIGVLLLTNPSFFDIADWVQFVRHHEWSGWGVILLTAASFLITVSGAREYIPALRRGYWFQGWLDPVMGLVAAIGLAGGCIWFGLRDLFGEPEWSIGGVSITTFANWSGLTVILAGTLALAERVRVALDRPRNAGRGTYATILASIEEAQRPASVKSGAPIRAINVRECRELLPALEAYYGFARLLAWYLRDPEDEDVPDERRDDCPRTFSQLLQACFQGENDRRLEELTVWHLHSVENPELLTGVPVERRLSTYHALLDEAMRLTESGISTRDAIADLCKTHRDEPADHCRAFCLRKLFPRLMTLAGALDDPNDPSQSFFLLDKSRTEDVVAHATWVLTGTPTITTHVGRRGIRVPFLYVLDVLSEPKAYERVWNRPSRTYPVFRLLFGSNPRRSIIRRYHEFSSPHRAWKTFHNARELADHARGTNGPFFELLDDVVRDAVAITLFDDESSECTLYSVVDQVSALYDCIAPTPQSAARAKRVFAAAAARNIALGPRVCHPKTHSQFMEVAFDGNVIARFQQFFALGTSIAHSVESLNHKVFRNPMRGLLTFEDDQLVHFENAVLHRDTCWFRFARELSSLWDPQHDYELSQLARRVTSAPRRRPCISPSVLGAVVQFFWPIFLIWITARVWRIVRRHCPALTGKKWLLVSITWDVMCHDWPGLARTLRDLTSEERFDKVGDPTFDLGDEDRTVRAMASCLYSRMWLWWKTFGLRRAARNNPGSIPLRVATGVAYLYRARSASSKYLAECLEWLGAAESLCNKMRVQTPSNDCDALNSWSAACEYYFYRYGLVAEQWNRTDATKLMQGLLRSSGDYYDSWINNGPVLWRPYCFGVRIEWLRRLVRPTTKKFIKQELLYIMRELKALEEEAEGYARETLSAHHVVAGRLYSTLL